MRVREMKVITKKWSKWVSIPLAAVLVLGTIIGVQMTLGPGPASASGVTATSVSLTGQVAANDYTFVQFDIAWDYSADNSNLRSGILYGGRSRFRAICVKVNGIE